MELPVQVLRPGRAPVNSLPVQTPGHGSSSITSPARGDSRVASSLSPFQGFSGWSAFTPGARAGRLFTIAPAGGCVAWGSSGETIHNYLRQSIVMYGVPGTPWNSPRSVVTMDRSDAYVGNPFLAPGPPRRLALPTVDPSLGLPYPGGCSIASPSGGATCGARFQRAKSPGKNRHVGNVPHFFNGPPNHSWSCAFTPHGRWKDGSEAVRPVR